MTKRIVRLLAALLLTAVAVAQLELHFIDVGQGDAVLMRTPEGHVVVYDGGRSATEALAYLQSLGVHNVDLVIASHAHADHIGGLAAIVSQMQPRFFADNGIAHTTKTYEGLLRAVSDSSAQLLEPGERLVSLGDVTIRILPVPISRTWGHNENSVGIIVEYGGFRASFFGDAEERQQAWLLTTVPHLLAAVQVHKASHHGSSNGDTDALMQLLRPELVVISSGAGNSYGHPSETTLRLYSSVGAEVLRTDMVGSIVITAQSNGSFGVRTSKATARAVLGPPTVAPSPRPAPSQPQAACCRVCRTGKACGDSCIARTKQCTKPQGCACNAEAWTDDIEFGQARPSLHLPDDVALYGLVAETCASDEAVASMLFR